MKSDAKRTGLPTAFASAASDPSMNEVSLSPGSTAVLTSFSTLRRRCRRRHASSLWSSVSLSLAVDSSSACSSAAPMPACRTCGGSDLPFTFVSAIEMSCGDVVTWTIRARAGV